MKNTQRNADLNKKTTNQSYVLISGVIQASAIVIGFLIAFIVAYSLFSVVMPSGSWINVVSGNSMEPTLNNGQIIFTDSDDVNRGDIVTLTVPENAPNSVIAKGKTLVKRIVGTPGDKILITQTGVYINDTLLDEHYLTEEAAIATYEKDKINYIELGNNEYFVMGDNRGASYDSRMFGAIAKDNILYKQSATPTPKFYFSLIISLLIFVVTCVVYMLVENGVINLACKLLSFDMQNAKTNTKNDTENNTEKKKLKGDNE